MTTNNVSASGLPSHPMQPVISDEAGILRFKVNVIVWRLLNEGSINMNQIRMWEVSDEDRMQFAQLIGYSISGYSELDYVTDESLERAEELVRDLGRG
jgi:hypothetical protein